MSEPRTILQKILAIFLALIMVLSVVLGSASQIYAAENSNKIVINNFEQLIKIAIQSWDPKNNGFEGKTLVLNDDINLKDMDQQLINALKNKHLTIGKKGCPFRGTFDGQNHRISNLKYNEKFLVDANGGLFFGVEGGTVKNLIIDNADINSALQGGLVAGYGKKALFQNITVLNSDFRIDTVNNVLSLITNAGFTGGAIVGSIDESTLYNCEISGTYVHNNVTNGVSALGGEGMYMGGLVGWASNSTIEYCRARSNYADENNGGGIRQSHIKNKYDIAVGALGGKSLYAGGIVGGVNKGTNIVDCFSTAEVEFYAANYVAVGSGIAGYGGGIAGALRGDGSTIERCHYAGDIHSYQYNAIAVIPIIQHDANISGINYLYKNDSSVKQSYFRPSDIKSGASIGAVHNKNAAEYGPLDDETYSDVNFWEEKGYDFKGTTSRTNPGTSRPQPQFDGNAHINKWVMDYDLGIPVHGNAVGATFDFPGAGSIQIGKTGLVGEPVTTEDPYSFAIQGINPAEEQVMTFNPKPFEPLNEGYQFKGWYQKEDVLSSKRSVQDIKELQDITADPKNKVGTEFSARMNVKDNQLFVGAVEGEVKYHNVNGDVIQQDLHRYETPLKVEKTPMDAPKGAKLYGWTTIPKVENNTKKGYSSITSTEINAIKQKNELYRKGDPVLKAMDLYPIYVDSKVNAITIFEGHEQDEIDDPTKRVGVGKTEVSTDANGVFINVTGEGINGAFPEGYRFKGWYKQISDENNTNEVCVSRNEKYYVPDLTEKVTYVARFEYKVTYMVKVYAINNGNFNEPRPYTSRWHDYNETLQEILGLAFSGENIIHWGNDYFDHSAKDATDAECGRYIDKKVTEPMNAYCHNDNNLGVSANNYAVLTDSDFEGAGTITGTKIRYDNYKFQFKPLNPRYKLRFWTLESDENQNKHWTYVKNPMSTGTLLSSSNYYGKARITADIYFHSLDENGSDCTSSVIRRYDDPILISNPINYEYKYPHLYTNISVDLKPVDGSDGAVPRNMTSEPSPSDEQMNRQGYAFLGWTTSAQVVKDSFEWNYIYDVKDTYCTSDIEKVKPYLVKESDKIHEVQDLYPVYAKYDVEATNNILELGQLPANVQKPQKPQYTITPDAVNKGKATITITAEHNSTDILSDKTGEKYKLDSIVCEHDGKRKELNIKEAGPNQYVVNDFPIVAGQHYKFIANYSPLLVVYHTNDKNTTKTVVRNAGEHLGALLEPDYANISGITSSDNNTPDTPDACFIGWTRVKPVKGCVHKFNSGTEFSESKYITKDSILTKNYVVKETMGLYPVFIKPSVIINSNIDSIITKDNKHPKDYRNLVRKGTSMELTAKDYPGYIFMGWYTGYVNDQNPGTKVEASLLTSEALYKNQTYTAVYKESLAVNYHDLSGNVIYTANVESGSRSFVEQIKDENGKPIPDKEYMIDSGANEALLAKLKFGQEFHEWQWKNGNQMVTWKDFKNASITQNMELYPSIIKMSAKDSNKADYTSIDFNVVEESKVDPTAKEGELSLAGLFTENYNQPDLTLNLQLSNWDPVKNGENTISLNNIRTRMYLRNGKDKVVEASDGPISTDKDGNALHEFFGKIIFTKKYSNVTEGIKGQTVYIELTDADNQKRVVPIEITEDKDTKVLEGKAIVNLPVGTYTAKEDSKWSWRDSSSGLGNTPVVINIGDEKDIQITNTRNNNKWFDGFSRKKNVFNEKR